MKVILGRPPAAGFLFLHLLCCFGKHHFSCCVFVCASSCLLGYWSTQSHSGMETGAPLQRIEGLGVMLVHSASMNVAYTCVTGRRWYFRVNWNARIPLPSHHDSYSSYCCYLTICKQSIILTITIIDCEGLSNTFLFRCIIHSIHNIKYLYP